MTGRPKRYNLDYFSHDVDMRNDPKIKALRAKYGLQGYAVYVMLLEILGDADNLMILWDEISIEIYSWDIGISAPEITSIVDYCEKIGLLVKENNIIYCKTLDKRASFVFEKRGHNISRLPVSATETTISDTETLLSDAENTQSKVKESKYIYSTDFETFWSQYPKKVGKGNAFLKWKIAIKTTNPQDIISGAKKYCEKIISSKTDAGYIKNPEGWISARRWEDDYTIPTKPAPPKDEIQKANETYREDMLAWEDEQRRLDAEKEAAKG